MKVGVHGCLSGAYALKLDRPHRFCPTKTFLGIEDFETGEAALAVVIGGDAFAEMFRGHCCLTKCNAQGVDFGVVADLHI